MRWMTTEGKRKRGKKEYFKKGREEKRKQEEYWQENELYKQLRKRDSEGTVRRRQLGNDGFGFVASTGWAGLVCSG